MALKQHAKGFTDDLNKLTEQQLRSFLEEELDSEDVNYELIKKITGVLAAKANEKPIDAEAAYQQFLSQYADTDPLNEELEQEAGALEMNDSILEAEKENSLGRSGKVVHFSRLAKIGILVAAIVALFLAISAVASAMGFSIWRATVSWDKDNMGLSSVEGKPVAVDEDPYSRIRLAMNDEGVQAPVVPYYLPSGYHMITYKFADSDEGSKYIIAFQNEENCIILSYYVSPKEYNAFYPKDSAEPEIYSVSGIDHYLTTNEGYYRAVWSNGEVVCELYGLESKEELLDIINSIYKE